jgi:hypothetical protein
MATSGTTGFTMTVDDLVAEAIDRIGGETTSGYELRAARRTLNLFLLDFANRGVNLWAVERGELALVSGLAEYVLPADTVDWLNASLSRDGSDVPLERMSQADYLRLPTKSQTGRPVQFLVERPRGAPVATFWPVPDRADTVLYRRTRRLEDAGTMLSELDMPPRYLPALVSGLAWKLGEKRATIDQARRAELKVLFEEDLERAQDEDRERVSVRVYPKRRR